MASHTVVAHVPHAAHVPDSQVCSAAMQQRGYLKKGMRGQGAQPAQLVYGLHGYAMMVLNWPGTL
jgi:hypothetical protein